MSRIGFATAVRRRNRASRPGSRANAASHRERRSRSDCSPRGKIRFGLRPTRLLPRNSTAHDQLAPEQLSRRRQKQNCATLIHRPIYDDRLKSLGKIQRALLGSIKRAPTMHKTGIPDLMAYLGLRLDVAEADYVVLNVPGFCGFLRRFGHVLPYCPAFTVLM